MIRLSDRLAAGEARWLRRVIQAGGYGLVLEDMAGILARGKAAIAGQERGRHVRAGPQDENGGGQEFCVSRARRLPAGR